MSMIYADILSYVNNICTDYIGTNVAKVAAAISPTAYALLGIYIMLWGLASMRGMIQEPIMDAAIRILKIVFIFSLAIKLANYNVYITDTFFKTPEQLAQALTQSADEKTTIKNLDTIVDKGFLIGKGFWDKGGLLSSDIGLYIAACFVYSMTVVVTAYACFLLILAKIAMTLIIGIGPLFILTLLFQSTATFFNSWVQQLSNYFLLIILVIAANMLILQLFVNAAAQVTAPYQIDKIFPFLITGVVSLLVLGQLPSIASGLAGGISLSSYGAGRMGLSLFSRPTRKVSGMLLNKTAKAGKAATQYAARKVMTAYKSRRNNIKKQ